MQHDLASKEADIKDLKVKENALQAGEGAMLTSTTSLEQRYNDVSSNCKVGYKSISCNYSNRITKCNENVSES